MFVTNWISTTKIQKISEITNFFRHYFLSRTEVKIHKCSRLQFLMLECESWFGTVHIRSTNETLYACVGKVYMS